MTKDETRQIALTYAPVIAHKVDTEWTVADQITRVDVGGIWDSIADNPLLLDDPNAVFPAAVYFTVCETSTHYFVLYAVYHIFDWWKKDQIDNLYDLIRDQVDEHVHDIEGALFVITKKPGALIDGLVTVAHNNFYLYTEPRTPTARGESRAAFPGRSLRISKFNEDVDGSIWLDGHSRRPRLYVQSRGHGMYGDQRHWGGGDEIWYYYPRDEQSQVGTIDPEPQARTRSVPYDLISVFEPDGLWVRRWDPRVFKQNKDGKWALVHRRKGKLGGDRIAGKANPPWAWNDHNDTSPVGEIAYDPARFIQRYGQGWGPVSSHYIYNPFLGIGLEG